MILIWGFRVRGSTIGQGDFFCPKCGGDRHYTHKRARRWFTLFFIPLIPLKEIGEYVECGTCRTTYQPAVLGRPTTSGLQSMLVSATREALVGVLRLGAAPAAHAAALEILSSAAGQPWTAAALDADLAGLDITALVDHARELSAALNEHGREAFLTDVTLVARADGPIDAGERNLLEQLAAALGLSPAHARGVIDLAGERRPSPEA